MSQVLYWKKVLGTEPKTERLSWLAEAFSDYGKRTGRKEGKAEFLETIKKNPYGKPETTLDRVYFNISHSKNVWCVIFSDRPCGVDAECPKERNVEKIAGRFFSPKETELVEKDTAGDLFYRIWTRKESYVKFLGVGFSEGYSSYDMADCSGLLQEKEGAFFQEIREIPDCFLCVCSEKKEPVEICRLSE